MSDPDSPTPPRDDAPGGQPETPGPGEPTEPMPTQPGTGPVGPGDATPPQGYPPPPVDPEPAATEPTIQMPATAAAAGVAAGAAAGAAATPSSTEYVLDGEMVPWYRRPAYLAMVALAVLLAAALIAWLLFAGDDDEPDADEVSVRIQIVDDQGEAIDRSFTAEVTGPPGAEESFTWLQPTSTSAVAGGRTGSSGQIDFRWEPDDTVVDPATWESTIRITEFLPVGWTPPGPPVECDLQRASGSDALITMNVDVVPVDDAEDATIDRVAGYSFPNQTFVPGDAVECEIVSTGPPVETTTTTAAETTTTGESTTTTEETTTTTLPTTAPPTAAPTTPPPTAAPTTPPPTAAPTTTTTTVPAPPDTLLTLIRDNPDLSRLNDLITLAGLETLLGDPDETLTFFAPNNDAIDNYAGPVDLTDSGEVRSLLLAHAHQGDAWTVADLDQLAAQGDGVPVVNGGDQPLDGSESPPLVGTVGAEIVDPDGTESNGTLQVIDAMLTIV